MKNTVSRKQTEVVRKVRSEGAKGSTTGTGTTAEGPWGGKPKPTTRKAPLSSDEKKALVANEQTIKHHLLDDWKVAEALTDTCERKLYRETYRTFKEYCPKCLRLSHSRARQLIGALAVRKHLEEACGMDMLPETECQVRPLTHLRKKPDLQVKAWESAWSKAKGQPTGIQVKKAVEVLAPRTPRSRDAKVAGLLRGLATLSKDATAVDPAVAALLASALKLLAEPQKPQEDKPSKSRKAKA